MSLNKYCTIFISPNLDNLTGVWYPNVFITE